MRNAQDILIESLMSGFEGLGLSLEQEEKIEEYFRGTGFASESFNLGIGDATLDLNDSRYSTNLDKIRKNFGKMDKHIEDGLYSRFFDVAFQIFGITIESGLGYFRLTKAGQKPAQALAIAASNAAVGRWIRANNYKYVYDILNECKKNPEVVSRALDYTKKSSAVVRLMILSCLFYDGPGSEPIGRIYFMSDAKAGQSSGFLGGLFKGLIKGLTGSENGENGEIKRVNAAPVGNVQAFNEMCSIFEECAGSIFTPALSDFESEKLKNYIRHPENFEQPVPQDMLNTFGKDSKYKLIENMENLLLPLAALNYRKSPILANFLRLIMVIDTYNTCSFLQNASYKSDMMEEAVRWYYDLTPDVRYFIILLARKNYVKTLKLMAECEPEAYLGVIRAADLSIYPVLLNQTGSVPKQVYDSYYADLKSSGQNDKKQKIMDQIIAKGNAKDGTDLAKLSNEVLLGEKPISALYPYTGEIVLSGWSSYWNNIKAYAGVYGEDDFVKNAVAYIALRGHMSTVIQYCTDGRSYKDPDFDKIFKLFDEKQIDTGIKYNIAVGMYDSLYGDQQKKMEKLIYKYFAGTLATDTDTMLAAFSGASSTGRIFAVNIINESNIPQKKEALLSYVKDTSKQVKAVLIPALEGHKDWDGEYVKLLSSKKAGERELAANLLAKCKGDYSDVLKEAITKEKNEAALKAMAQALGSDKAVDEGNPELASAISKASGIVPADALIPDNIVKELHKGGKKRSIAWIYAFEGDMPVVHFAEKKEKAEDTGETTTPSEKIQASEEYLSAILLAYSSLPTPGVSDQGKILAAELDKAELAVYMQEVYERFMKDGAEAKKKWVLYATAIHGGSAIVPVLKHQIDEWAGASRGAIAAEAIKALALNDSPTALLIVDNIARKYKFKQVRNAAKEALSFAAGQLGLTVEELSDRIVPDLGFNAAGERVFDYGTRSFTVRITPALDIIIKNNDGKAVKSMPAPGKSDDEAKAGAAYAEFKEMKTQMKTVVKNQAARLELALSSIRLWNKENWENLFVKNPIMHQFAISLIWGVYDKDLKPVQTFRYMEDGSFNTVDEDEYTIPDDANIGLIHPVEISEDERKAWQQQLEDYEIKQSVDQLARPVYLIEEDEKKARKLSRFNGASITDVTLINRLVSMGWEKGPALDAGVFVHFYREDKDAGLGVELSFSGAYIGGGYDYSEDVDVQDARFYHPDKTKLGYGYDSIKDDQALTLSEIPARYFSEIVYQLTRATVVSNQSE